MSTIPPFIGQAIPQQTAQVSGTTLFHIAAQYLQDATQWDRVALANQTVVTINDFIDPWITSLVTLNIPNPGVSDGGILNV
jgi:hypothetical protein